MPDTATQVAVRPLRAGDFDRWKALWDGYLSFYRQELTDEVTSTVFARLSAGERGTLGLVAVDTDDEPVGIAHLVFHPSTWSTVDKCYLEDLYVDPSHRGGGTARAIFDGVFVQARERGCELVYWHTQQYNGSARSLYDRVGHVTSMVVYEHRFEQRSHPG